MATVVWKTAVANAVQINELAETMRLIELLHSSGNRLARKKILDSGQCIVCPLAGFVAGNTKA